MRHLSPLKQKILLTLVTGVALGFSYSPMRQKRVFKAFLRDWETINQRSLRAAVGDLHRAKLLQKRKSSADASEFILTTKGKHKAISYQFERLALKKRKWDKRWRFVSFDIPMEWTKHRNILRKKLCALGFQELQQSVFVVPYECREEMEFIVGYLNVRRYVRYGVIQSIDNEDELKRSFHLS